MDASINGTNIDTYMNINMNMNMNVDDVEFELEEDKNEDEDYDDVLENMANLLTPSISALFKKYELINVDNERYIDNVPFEILLFAKNLDGSYDHMDIYHKHEPESFAYNVPIELLEDTEKMVHHNFSKTAQINTIEDLLCHTYDFLIGRNDVYGTGNHPGPLAKESLQIQTHLISFLDKGVITLDSQPGRFVTSGEYGQYVQKPYVEILFFAEDYDKLMEKIENFLEKLKSIQENDYVKYKIGVCYQHCEYLTKYNVNSLENYGEHLKTIPNKSIMLGVSHTEDDINDFDFYSTVVLDNDWFWNAILSCF